MGTFESTRSLALTPIADGRRTRMEADPVTKAFGSEIDSFGGRHRPRNVDHLVGRDDVRASVWEHQLSAG